MTSVSRGRRWPALGGAAAGVALAIAGGCPALAGDSAVGGAAVTASASGALTVGPGVVVSVRRGGTVRSLTAGALAVGLDGRPVPAYRLELAGTPAAAGETYTERPGDPGVRRPGTIRWLLAHGYPGTDAGALLTAAGRSVSEIVAPPDAIAYAATQAAIWHYGDGADLAYASGRAATARGADDRTAAAAVEAVYRYLLRGADRAADLPEPRPTLRVTPAGATGAAGTRVGPFLAEVAGGDVGLAATGGTVIDPDGRSLSGLPGDGRFWVTSAAAGVVTVTAAGTVTVPAGRVFAREHRQRLILATSGRAALAVRVTVRFTPGGADGAGTGGTAGADLPVTGPPAVRLAAVGALLAAGGVLLVLALCRRRVRFVP